MSRLKHKRDNELKRQHKVRTSIKANSIYPRLTVKVSNRHISAQIIDDSQDKSIIGVSTVGKKFESKSLKEQAEWIGSEIANKAKSKKIKKVAYDRGGKLYHGRIKAVADSARKAGLEL